MSNTILITGINGFVGKHLAKQIHSQGYVVHGIGQRELAVASDIEDVVDVYQQCNITSSNEVANLELRNISAIINLAGLANVGASFDNPELYMKVNTAVLSVLGAEYLKQQPQGRMIAISTGALYDPNQPMPLSERAASVKNGSPYALSKLSMEQAARTLRENGLECIIARPFNHIGPGQGPGFLIPDLMSKLKAIDEHKPTLLAGNLKTVRDFSDVRDICRAYALLATAPKLNHPLYNVCSGTGHNGEDMVKELCLLMGIDFESLDIQVDQALIRPSDPPEIVGNHNRLTQDTGWQPEIPLSQTVADIVTSLD